MSTRDSRQLLRQLRRIGWTIEQRGWGAVVYSPKGDRCVIHGTPSSGRWLRNKRAELRRLGANI